MYVHQWIAQKPGDSFKIGNSVYVVKGQPVIDDEDICHCTCEDENGETTRVATHLTTLSFLEKLPNI